MTLIIWKSGEKLYQKGELSAESEKAQREAMEADDRVGLVEEYLNTPLPEKWADMDLYDRRNWLADQSFPARQQGTALRTEVSNPEIWAECFGRNPADMKAADSYAIAALMTQVEGWERTRIIRSLPIYGRQRLYVRCL